METILVIDDNQMVLKTIRSILSEFGWYHIETAKDGKESYRLLFGKLRCVRL